MDKLAYFSKQAQIKENVILKQFRSSFKIQFQERDSNGTSAEEYAACEVRNADKLGIIENEKKEVAIGIARLKELLGVE